MARLDDQQRQAQCEAVYAELEHEVNGARSSGRKAELRDILAQFTVDCAEYGDPADLAEKLEPPHKSQRRLEAATPKETQIGTNGKGS